MTYGGIWQPVTLRRHGPVAVRWVRCSSDPDDLTLRWGSRTSAAIRWPCG